jgi:hypothetical protein
MASLYDSNGLVNINKCGKHNLSTGRGKSDIGRKKEKRKMSLITVN